MNNLMKKLLSKLKENYSDSELATDEEYNLIDISDDPYLEEIIMNGEFFSSKNAMVCDMEVGRCHQSVVEILKEDNKDDILYTGFALHTMNDEWFTHSFIVNKGSIVESGPIVFRSYLGVPLEGNDRLEFIKRWKD